MAETKMNPSWFRRQIASGSRPQPVDGYHWVSHPT